MPITLGLALLLAAGSARGTPDPSRGELLYENHCQSCHTSTLHVRAMRKANSAAEVERWVRERSGAIHLEWTDEDVLDVTDFLVRRYYTFPQTTPETTQPSRGPKKVR